MVSALLVTACRASFVSLGFTAGRLARTHPSANCCAARCVSPHRTLCLNLLEHHCWGGCARAPQREVGAQRDCMPPLNPIINLGHHCGRARTPA